MSSLLINKGHKNLLFPGSEASVAISLQGFPRKSPRRSPATAPLYWQSTLSSDYLLQFLIWMNVLFTFRVFRARSGGIGIRSLGSDFHRNLLISYPVSDFYFCNKKKFLAARADFTVPEVKLGPRARQFAPIEMYCWWPKNDATARWFNFCLLHGVDFQVTWFGDEVVNRYFYRNILARFGLEDYTFSFSGGGFLKPLYFWIYPTHYFTWWSAK